MLPTLGLANTTLFASEELGVGMEAIAEGWSLGKRTEPLFGTDWNALFAVPLERVPVHFGLPALSGQPVGLAG